MCMRGKSITLMTQDMMKDEIIQLKARIKELESSMDELANSSFTVIKYFRRKYELHNSIVEHCKRCSHSDE